MSPADVQALRDALEGLHEARARLDDLLTRGSAPELRELHAVVLSTVKRLLREMDLDERVRRQVRLAPRVRRPRPGAPAPGGRPGRPGARPDAETQVMPRVGNHREPASPLTGRRP